MNIYVNGLNSSYDIEHLTRLFYKEAQIKPYYPKHLKNQQDFLLARITNTRMVCIIKKDTIKKVFTIKHTKTENKQNTKDLSKFCYNALVEFFGKKPVWGYLTGVRPVRLIHDMWKKGMTDSQVKDVFLNEFDTSIPKFELAFKTAKIQKQVLPKYNKNDYSLYVSIPFCPSRCSYCSFVSRTTQNAKQQIQPYIDKLCLEIKQVSKIASQHKLNLKTIYIGGGTPTAISNAQLQQLMDCIKNNFDISKVLEYTVEAGRPDCTDIEKLETIKKYGATRLSINPQTFNNDVLKEIGRNHTSDDIINCYENARKVGHTNINMDLIAGLPSDTVDSFKQSLQTALQLSPENITVHTLTLKRASNIVIEHRKQQYDDVEEMIDYTNILMQNGYNPYYMYRQKNTLNNLENTSFCKAGYEGYYNIFIMEEIHSILSVGAGGVTKLCDMQNNKIDRIFNFKYPTEYINDFDEIISRKKGVEDFYASYLDT